MVAPGADLILAIELAVLFGAADFATGRTMKPWWPTRSIYLTAPIVIATLAAYGLGRHEPAGWPLLGLTWALWRAVFGWGLFGGALNPKGDCQALALLGRNLISAVPAGLVLIFAFDLNAVVVLGWWIAFCCYATLCNIWLTIEAERGNDVDPEVDALHGVCFGLSVAIAIHMSELMVETSRLPLPHP